MRISPKSLIAAVVATSLYGALSMTSPADAQDIQNYQPAPGSWNYLSVDGADTAPNGLFVPSLHINYGRNPLARRDESNDIVEHVVESLVTMDMIAAYSFNDWLELAVAVPFSMVGGGNGLDRMGRSDGFALNDIRLLPKVNLFGRDAGPFGVAVTVPVSVPTGDTDLFLSNDTFVAHPKAVGEYRRASFRVAANMGYRYRPKNESTQSLEVGNEMTYGVAGDVEIGMESLHALAEIFGSMPVEDVEDEQSARPLEFRAGARYFTQWCGVFTAGAGTGIVADYGAPDYRVLTSFTWVCKDADPDHDGIPTRMDICPDVPEDRDGFEDQDGCPDPDNDQDGIPDDADRCPDDAEDMDNFEDTNGCPEPDNDQDGIIDGDDMCPQEAEDPDDFEDQDGCADPDNDGDGIRDVSDKCPMSPEDFDDFQDRDGCADPDNDGDGIADTVDKCPLQAEVINGNDDEDGCPDSGRSKVVVTQEKIEITDRVYFDLGKTVIKRRSFDVLNQVASVLKNHPEIKRIRIEGHTDRSASARINKPLSQRRAESVRLYLVNQGVRPDRLEAVGYGASRPLISGKGPDAAASNRRVEFVILPAHKLQSQSDPDQPAPIAHGSSSPAR